MAKLITKFKYYKPKGKMKIGGYLKYIATRDGVEKSNSLQEKQLSSLSQRQLIEKLLKDFPDCKDMLEYEDYLKEPTIKNATEFISRAIEDNIGRIDMKGKTYADYIATRPNVEVQGTHGLFSSDDEPIVLSKVSEELNAHEGNIWTMIFSLRREDAQRLGYEKAYLWRDMLKSHTEEIANALKIPITNLKWYAAFHNESHHPHIHLIAYSIDTQRGYLTKTGVNQLRSVLANDIFKDELQHIYAEQTRLRDELKLDWKIMLQEIMEKVSNGNFANKETEEKLLRLAKRLSNTKKNRSYGYLKQDLKALVDSIVDDFAKDERIEALYDLWYQKQNEKLLIYGNELPPKIPLSKNKEFRSIKNEVIKEAKAMFSETNNSEKQYTNYIPNKISATAISRLFKGIANIIQNKVNDDNGHKSPKIDKRQKQEIEDKKNAEISFV